MTDKQTVTQLSLFPGVVPPIRHHQEEHLVEITKAIYARSYSDQEVDYIWNTRMCQWLGALMLGFFDRKILKKGHRLTGITLSLSGYRPTIIIRSSDTRLNLSWVVTDLTREKVLRSVYWQARNGRTNWKVDKFRKKLDQ